MAWTRPGGTVWLCTLTRPWRRRSPSGESATVNPKNRVNWPKTASSGRPPVTRIRSSPPAPSVRVTAHDDQDR